MRLAALSVLCSGLCFALPAAPADTAMTPAGLHVAESDAEPDGQAGDEITRMVTQMAAAQRVPVKLVIAVIVAESGGNPEAESPKGAQGLMQLMPKTAEWCGIQDAFDPTDNIYCGIRYLRKLLDEHNGNLAFTAAAYNAGETAVREYGGIPPYEETRNYVNQVLAFIHQ